MKSDVKILVSSLIAAIIISGGTITFIDYQANKEHAEAMNTQLKKSEYDTKTNKALKNMRLESARKDYSRDVATMTYNSGNMPASKERTDFTNHVLVVIKDNVITDDEFNALSSEMQSLSLTNRVRRIKNKAEQIATSKEG